MKFVLRLYIKGRTATSRRAIENLEDICESDLRGDYEVEVIDVIEHPKLAEDEKIIATPTLVKMRPDPIRKIIGDLSKRDMVLEALDLVRSPPAPASATGKKA